MNLDLDSMLRTVARLSKTEHDKVLVQAGSRWVGDPAVDAAREVVETARQQGMDRGVTINNAGPGLYVLWAVVERWRDAEGGVRGPSKVRSTDLIAARNNLPSDAIFVHRSLTGSSGATVAGITAEAVLEARGWLDAQGAFSWIAGRIVLMLQASEGEVPF